MFNISCVISYFLDGVPSRHKKAPNVNYCTVQYTYGGFIKGILRGVRCTKSLRVLFLHRRPPYWTTLVLYSRAIFIFNEPAYRQIDKCKQNVSPYLCRKWIVHMDAKSNCQIYFLCFNVWWETILFSIFGLPILSKSQNRCILLTIVKENW